MSAIDRGARRVVLDDEAEALGVRVGVRRLVAVRREPDAQRLVVELLELRGVEVVDAVLELPAGNRTSPEARLRILGGADLVGSAGDGRVARSAHLARGRATGADRRARPAVGLRQARVRLGRLAHRIAAGHEPAQIARLRVDGLGVGRGRRIGRLRVARGARVGGPTGVPYEARPPEHGARRHAHARRRAVHVGSGAAELALGARRRSARRAARISGRAAAVGVVAADDDAAGVHIRGRSQRDRRKQRWKATRPFVSWGASSKSSARSVARSQVPSGNRPRRATARREQRDSRGAHPDAGARRTQQRRVLRRFDRDRTRRSRARRRARRPAHRSETVARARRRARAPAPDRSRGERRGRLESARSPLEASSPRWTKAKRRRPRAGRPRVRRPPVPRGAADAGADGSGGAGFVAATSSAVAPAERDARARVSSSAWILPEGTASARRPRTRSRDAARAPPETPRRRKARTEGGSPRSAVLRQRAHPPSRRQRTTAERPTAGHAMSRPLDKRPHPRRMPRRRGSRHR